MKKFLAALTLLFITLCVQAQNAPDEPATGMRSNGKIYVVMAVVLTVLAGVIVYLIRLDRKVSKLEKKHL